MLLFVLFFLVALHGHRTRDERNAFWLPICLSSSTNTTWAISNWRFYRPWGANKPIYSGRPSNRRPSYSAVAAGAAAAAAAMRIYAEQAKRTTTYRLHDVFIYCDRSVHKYVNVEAKLPIEPSGQRVQRNWRALVTVDAVDNRCRFLWHDLLMGFSPSGKTTSV